MNYTELLKVSASNSDSGISPAAALGAASLVPSVYALYLAHNQSKALEHMNRALAGKLPESMSRQAARKIGDVAGAATTTFLSDLGKAFLKNKFK